MTWPPGENLINLSADGDEIRIQVWHGAHGHEIEGFSIQLVTTTDGEQRSVVRYDNSHGSYPHRDILNWDGSTQRQIKMRDGLTVTEAFEEALGFMFDNWRQYVEDFMRRRP